MYPNDENTVPTRSANPKQLSENEIILIMKTIEFLCFLWLCEFCER